VHRNSHRWFQTIFKENPFQNSGLKSARTTIPVDAVQLRLWRRLDQHNYAEKKKMFSHDTDQDQAAGAAVDTDCPSSATQNWEAELKTSFSFLLTQKK
jgi:hypothetical protein